MGNKIKVRKLEEDFFKDKLGKSQKSVFWQALVLSLIVFGSGIFLGFMLEGSRVGKIGKLYAESELSLLDIKLQSEIYSDMDIRCSTAIQENVNFADKVYGEAKILDRFENAARITESMKLQHKKYDLLRTLFWLNSIKIKQKCNAQYHNLVYFYRYNEPTTGEKAKQAVFSRSLQELKNKYGGKVMLIPIAADNNITSINLLVATYDIRILPTILIDEKIKITDVDGLADIDKYIK